MKVTVLGSGVIGVTTAYYLNQSGHEVTLVDRQAAPAMETSHSNGGQVSWGAASPWAAPGIPLTALKWMLRPRSPLVLRPQFDPAMWRWLFSLLRNCTSQRYAINKERQLRLSRYSHERLTALRQQTGLHYDERRHGLLTVYRRPRDLDRAGKHNALLDRVGVPYRMLDRAGCVAHEPGLQKVQAKIAGGTLFPEDESGDCHRFTEGLAALAQQNGVRFLPSTTIRQLVATGDRIERALTDQGAISAEAFVLACGSYSASLLQPLGIRLPVYPVKGYSLTIPITHETAAPQGTITDETYKTVITRLGGRLRAAGTAELTGYDLRLRPSRLAILEHVVRDLFPEAGDMTRAEHWAGLRPMTPDNPPILGPSPYKNLFLNTGHGTLGWTMACGSGKVLADLVSGKKPEVNLEGLTLARFR
ncbi:MAG: D-amino acid dehydrogenase [Pseudomonadota bacterium]